MDTLNSTEPHYIRCVKPNNLLKPAVFENANIMQQLRCGVSTFFDIYAFFWQFWVVLWRGMVPNHCYFLFVWLLLIVVPIGCFRGYQNQLCWIPHSPSFLWIPQPVWASCPRVLGRKVSIIFLAHISSGKNVLEMLNQLIFLNGFSSEFFEQLWWKGCMQKDFGKERASGISGHTRNSLCCLWNCLQFF